MSRPSNLRSRLVILAVLASGLAACSDEPRPNADGGGGDGGTTGMAGSGGTTGGGGRGGTTGGGGAGAAGTTGVAGRGGTTGVAGAGGAAGGAGAGGTTGVAGAGGAAGGAAGRGGTTGVAGAGGAAGGAGAGGTTGMAGAGGAAGGAGTGATTGVAGAGGAAGGAGAGGTTGVAGAGGTTGVAGAGGTTGVAGVGGTTGTAGIGGSAGGAAGGGTTGSAGEGGTTGVAGTTGAAGTTGVAGTTGAAGTTGVAGTTGTAGGGGAGGAAGGLEPAVPQGLAVLNGDFSSTSLSLLTIQGTLTRADCIHTTITAGGAKTISGDVVLPSQAQRGGRVVLIDRGNAALTFVNPTTCAVDRQISVRAGFELANPHDVIIVSDTKGYATRYGKNATPADPMAAGDDLMIFNPSNGSLTGRIDLAPYASQVAGAAVQARPDRALIANGRVVVSLNNNDASFANYGEGRLLVIDPATDQVLQNVALTGLRGCEGLDYVPTTKSVLVACSGSFGSVEQRLQSGIAIVDMSTTPATLTRVISGLVFAQPVNFLWVAGAPIGSGPNRAFAGTFGSFSPSVPDAVVLFDGVVGNAMPFATGGPFEIGRATYLGGLLFVPDAQATMPRVRVYNASGTGLPVLTASVAADTVNNFFPREVAPY